jgi:flagellum-specific peptidoglycan hydrolase FlgJ
VWTHEVENDVRIKIIDKFQKHTLYEDSIARRAAFFANNRRYHFLFDYDDPCDWAKGLQQAGYATDPTYADKLISIMRTADIRRDYYQSLTITDGYPNTQVRFLTGWLKRVDDCLRVNV